MTNHKANYQFFGNFIVYQYHTDDEGNINKDISFPVAICNSLEEAEVIKSMYQCRFIERTECMTININDKH